MDALERAEKIIPFPKPKRIVSRKAIEMARKAYCQVCGETRGLREVHHKKTKGAGGHDVSENLVCLCAKCHRLAQEGKLDLSEVETRDMRPLEELIQRLIDLEEVEQDVHWEKGAIMLVLTKKYKLSVRQTSSVTGISPAQVRALAQTFEAFPDPGMRVPTLSWYHHRIAAGTENPRHWIEQAADNEWSTRQFVERINESRASSEEAKEERKLQKAEKALRLVKEVLECGGKSSEWLVSELQKLKVFAVKKAS